MAKAELVGSWFPTGYHGHLRSKPRNDFICEFRKLARPQPPRKFIVRSQVKPTAHVFSAHDNKNAFRNDALYFEQGLGRRRDPKRSYAYNRNFISWLPPGRTVEDYPFYPLASTYRVNYQGEVADGKIPQIMIKRPMTSFDGVATTSYRYAHSSVQQNKDMIDAISNAGLMMGSGQRQSRAQKSRPESVASCLTWHVPEPPKQKRIPAATQTTDYTQGNSSPSGSMTQTNETAEKSKSGPIEWPHPPPQKTESE